MSQVYYMCAMSGDHFQKEASTNAVMLAVVKKFCHTGTILTQTKGHNGCPVTANAN